MQSPDGRTGFPPETAAQEARGTPASAHPFGPGSAKWVRGVGWQPEFKTGAALSMLAEEARREKWQAEEGYFEYLCERTGWLSPFYLNLLLATSMEAGRDRLLETGCGERILVRSDIDDAYDRLLAGRSRFRHWYQRLTRDLPEPQLGFTLAILGAISKAEKGLTRKQLQARLQRLEPDPDKCSERLNDALLLLGEDGYLDVDGERLCFFSFLLRDYWRRNHVS